MPTKKTAKPTEQEIAQWKKKAEKWDSLDKQVAKFYVDENGDEIDEDAGGDLGDIGEVAAIAFGYL